MIFTRQRKDCKMSNMGTLRTASQTLKVIGSSARLPKTLLNRGCLQRTQFDQSILQTFLSNRRSSSSFSNSLSFHRQFSLSTSLAADKTKSTLKKPVTPKGKFDLEDEAKKRELTQIREELRLKEEAEKAKDEEEEVKESYSMGELVNEVTGERGGPKGQEPTEYGDWQRKGRVTDF